MGRDEVDFTAIEGVDTYVYHVKNDPVPIPRSTRGVPGGGGALAPPLRSFLRAFLIVTLTAMNVRLVARGEWVAMFISGTLLSWIWWENTKMANNGGRRQQLAYAMGAGCGTVCGAWIGGMV